MRFLVMAMATKEFEGGPPPKPEAFAAMQEYNEEPRRQASSSPPRGSPRPRRVRA